MHNESQRRPPFDSHCALFGFLLRGVPMRRTFVVALSLVPSLLAAQGSSDWSAVERELGRPPAVSGGVARFGFPRTDLTVTTHGITVKPAFALGSWIAFVRVPGSATDAMAMGDLV